LINDLLARFRALHLQELRTNVEIKCDLVLLRVPFHFRCEGFFSLEGEDRGFSGKDVRYILLRKMLTQDLLRKPPARIPSNFIPSEAAPQTNEL
jgi:hypothetical protein